MNKKATVTLTKDYRAGSVEDRLYSSFVEHMGSCVYNGIYEPGHPQADADGLRRDVLELAKALNLPAIRYPGGNYTSGYNWEDTVGKNRPAKLDLAWKQLEPNTFGLHEFLKWLDQVGSDLIMTVNLGTRDADAARNVLEYCNHPGGTYYSEMRRENGADRPFGIKTWCLGNELDGTWQIGHKKAEEYGRLAAETARIMRMFQQDLELIAVGSSHGLMDTFPEWDRKVLMECYEDVDYIALHKYIGQNDRDLASYLAAPMEMEQQIKDIIAACDYVKSVKRSSKVMKLSFDEWNVASPQPIPEPKPDWQIGPDRDKTRWRFQDALTFGSMMLTLLRNADRVKIACQAILVNVIPMIAANRGGGAWRTTIYYPFLHGSLYGRGEVLRQLVDTPLYDCKEFTDVPVLDSAAVYCQEEDTVTLFAVNRGGEGLPLDLNLREFGSIREASHIEMAGDLERINTEQNPTACVPVEKPLAGFDPHSLSLPLKAYSWNVIRLKMNG